MGKDDAGDQPPPSVFFTWAFPLDIKDGKAATAVRGLDAHMGVDPGHGGVAVPDSGFENGGPLSPRGQVVTPDTNSKMSRM